jgi:hypothetical protein
VAFDGRFAGIIFKQGGRNPRAGRTDHVSLHPSLPGLRRVDGPWLGRGGLFHESGQPTAHTSLHDVSERAASVSGNVARAARKTVLPVILWVEGLRRTGSVFVIIVLTALSGLLVCAALGGLLYAASLVFAPQLQLLSHVLFFTPID